MSSQNSETDAKAVELKFRTIHNYAYLGHQKTSSNLKSPTPMQQ